jgi:hypothetical protein
MKCLKKILLGVAVGAVSMVMAGCYGVPHQSLDQASLETPPTLDAEPLAGLETIDPEKL